MGFAVNLKGVRITDLYQYMIREGFCPGLRFENLIESLNKACDKDRAQELHDWLGLMQSGLLSRQSLYQRINTAQEWHTLLSLQFDDEFESAEFVERILKLQKPESSKLLDLACGTGWFGSYLSSSFPTLRVVAVDRCKQLVAAGQLRYKDQVEFALADYGDFNEVSGIGADRFELIASMFPIEDADSDQNFLIQLRDLFRYVKSRVLPEGTFFLTLRIGSRKGMEMIVETAPEHGFELINRVSRVKGPLALYAFRSV